MIPNPEKRIIRPIEAFWYLDWNEFWNQSFHHGYDSDSNFDTNKNGQNKPVAVGEARGERLDLLLIGVAEVEDVELVSRVAGEEEHVQEERRAEQVAELFTPELKRGMLYSEE